METAAFFYTEWKYLFCQKWQGRKGEHINTSRGESCPLRCFLSPQLRLGSSVPPPQPHMDFSLWLKSNVWLTVNMVMSLQTSQWTTASTGKPHTVFPGILYHNGLLEYHHYMQTFVFLPCIFVCGKGRIFHRVLSLFPISHMAEWSSVLVPHDYGYWSLPSM